MKFKKTGTQNQIEGTVHTIKGKLKEKAGQITHQPKLEFSGKMEKIFGKVQQKIGRLESAVDK
jgi:uncharacterized protein YjbJ (UPF0337 family)